MSRLAKAALVALLVTGCGDDASDIERGQALEVELLRPLIDASSAEGAAGDVQNERVDAGASAPRGYFADVTANGTGCPSGTWDWIITAEGSGFKTVFRDFVASVDERSAVASKTCQLSFKLVTPGGVSYRIRTASQDGYAHLEAGVRATVLSSASVQGSTGEQPLQLDLRGPLDEGFAVHAAEQVFVSSDAGWSPCQVEQRVTINTRLLVINSAPRRQGHVRIENAAEFELEWRRCTQ